MKARFFASKFSELPSAAFHAIDFNPAPIDFEFHTITGMIDRLRQYILDHNLNQVLLIGTSQGANVALNYTHRFGGVAKMLLLAPELFYDPYISAKKLAEWKELVSAPVFHYGFGNDLPLDYGHHQDGLRYVDAPPPSVPMLIVHGVNDEAIPINRSREYAAENPDFVRLLEVDDNHFLKDHMDFIWEQTLEVFDLSNIVD
jgi:pimeloyl-ACP methyl ester carboxylesterase